MQESIKNFEFKAQVDNHDEIRKKLDQLAPKYIGEDRQCDTYIATNDGRLKIRKGPIENTLIFYKRENTKKAKESLIYLEKISADSNIKNLLERSHGILVEVTKKREIYFKNNVKIHIDTVDHLGTFFEVEAIDEKNEFSLQELKEQCDYYKDYFDIHDRQIMSMSYSDMILDSIKKSFYQEASSFLEKAIDKFEQQEISSANSTPDHICYRVKDMKVYLSWKAKLKTWGQLISEELISGREISTFVLDTDFCYGEHRVNVLELPAPKAGKVFEEGFEHAEFVTDTSLEDFIKENQHEFDTSGIDKKHTSEIKLSFGSDFCIKFHEKPLIDMIKEEFLSKIHK